MLELLEISSPALRGVRDVWKQSSSSMGERNSVIFLDAEFYIERVAAPETVEKLGLNAIYLSFGQAVDRHLDFTCNVEFTNFLAHDLLPSIGQTQAILCGLSLSGLAALFAATQFPDRFPLVLCQSPSAWWNDEWLATHLPNAEGLKVWMSVGTGEIESHAVHGPTGLVQNSSQLDSCRRLSECLKERGQQVRLFEFEGGHDPNAWALDLPQGMNWLLDRC